MVNLVSKTFFIRIAEGNLVEYEELFGTFAVDKLGNPARLFAKETGFMSSDLYFSRKIDGTWQEESYITDRAYGTNCRLFFDSQNRPVIVYSRRLSFDSSDLWVAKRVSGEWELTEVRGNGPPLYFHAAIGPDDRVRMAYDCSTEGGVFYAEENDEGWSPTMLLEDHEENGTTLKYWVGALTVDDSSRATGVFTEYDTTSEESLLLVGTDEELGWSFDPVTTIGSYSSVGAVGGFDIVVTAMGSKVVFLYFHNEDRADFYWNSGSLWIECMPLFWPISGDPEMALSPSGDAVLVSRDAIATYW